MYLFANFFDHLIFFWNTLFGILCLIFCWHVCCYCLLIYYLLICICSGRWSYICHICCIYFLSCLILNVVLLWMWLTFQCMLFFFWHFCLYTSEVLFYPNIWKKKIFHLNFLLGALWLCFLFWIFKSFWLKFSLVNAERWRCSLIFSPA